MSVKEHIDEDGVALHALAISLVEIFRGPSQRVRSRYRFTRPIDYWAGLVADFGREKLTAVAADVPIFAAGTQVSANANVHAFV